MTKTTITVLATVLSMSGSTALAQTGAPAAPFGRDHKLFVNVNAGGQAQAHTFDATATQSVYDQTATANTTTGIDGGPIFDLSAAYRFMKTDYEFLKHVGIAAGFSTFGKTGELSGIASIPHPNFRNRFQDVTLPTRDAKRTERSVYLMVVGSYPLTNQIEITAYVGPSFLNANQELVSGLSVPDGTQDASVTVSKESASGVGAILGVDASYFVTDRMGVGAFMRYNGGSVDLPHAENVKVGGFQLGVGARIRY